MIRNILIGIGASALVMMGTVGTGPADRAVAWSDLSIGAAPALAQADIPDILDTLDDLGVLDEDDGPDGDDGPDDIADDADDADNDAAAAPAPRRRVAKDTVCQERGRHADPTGQYAGSPCWARETFGSDSRRR